MEHHHSHHHDIDLNNAFKIGIALNIVFTLIEVIYGYLANSMALVADAGPMRGTTSATCWRSHSPG